MARAQLWAQAAERQAIASPFKGALDCISDVSMGQV
jgi:hypothetical protein